MSLASSEQPSSIIDLSAFIQQADTAAGERPVAVAVSDLDGLVALYESFGAEAATRALAAWERTLTGSLPDGAVVARISGDEWAIALPGATAESALIVLEEIRSHFSSHRVDGIDVDLDVSIGIAGRPPHAPTIEDAARAAVEALMRAKREGARADRHLRRGEDDDEEQLLPAWCARPARQAVGNHRPDRGKPAP